MLPDVALSLRSYGPTTLAHRHGHHQAVLPVRGRLQMEIGGAQGQVQAGHAGIIAAGAWHGCCADDRNEFLILDWETPSAPDDLKRFADNAAGAPFITYGPSLQLLLQFLGNGLRDGGTVAAHRGDWALMLLRSLVSDSSKELREQPRIIQRATAFARQHLQQAISTTDLADAAGVCTSRLHALFRHHLGQTPMAYVSDLRLEHAAALLASGDLPIAEVALSCGYGDQTALTRAMRRRHGTTPAAYRRRQQRH
jgi:AraC-like DNA-binding protein